MDSEKVTAGDIISSSQSLSGLMFSISDGAKLKIWFDSAFREEKNYFSKIELSYPYSFSFF
jgi:hypothetical protein